MYTKTISCKDVILNVVKDLYTNVNKDTLLRSV